MKRTLETAIDHLEKQIERGNKTLYLHMTEWELYALSLDEFSKREYQRIGYDTTVNPITGREEKCIAYKIYPVIAVDVPEFTYI